MNNITYRFAYETEVTMVPYHNETGDDFVLLASSQLLREQSVAIGDNRNGVALDADAQSMPFSVGDVDVEEDRLVLTAN